MLLFARAQLLDGSRSSEACLEVLREAVGELLPRFDASCGQAFEPGTRRAREVKLQVLHSGGPCASLAPDCCQVVFQPSFRLEHAVILGRLRCELEVFRHPSLADFATKAGCSTVFVFLVRVGGLASLASCVGPVDFALCDGAACIAWLGAVAVIPWLQL